MTTNNHPANAPVSLERLHQIREILSKASAQSDGGNLGYAMADAVKVIDGVLESIASEQVRCEHAAWSQATFGGVGPVGPLKHLSKELAKLFRKITNSEIDAEGNAHVVLFPADSLLINNARIALASMDAEPVGYFYADKPGDWYQISDGDRVPSHRRIPLYANPQSSPVVKLPNEFFSSEGIVVQIEKLMAVLAVHGIQYERRGNACRAAMLQAGNSPVTPDGWIPVSERMPEDGEHAIVFHPRDGVMQITFFFAYGKWWDSQEDDGGIPKSYFTHWQPLPAAPKQEVK